MSKRPTVDEIIAHLQLEPLPVEGGYFRRTYHLNHEVPREFLPGNYDHDKTLASAIYYLYTTQDDGFSALHRLPTTEIFHFYMGDPVEMLLLHPDGRSEHITLGHDILNGQQVQVIVPPNVWQGSRLRDGGTYALTGTTMTPAFEPSDYEGGERDALIQAYPHEAERIRQLTRPDSGQHMTE